SLTARRAPRRARAGGRGPRPWRRRRADPSRPRRYPGPPWRSNRARAGAARSCIIARMTGPAFGSPLARSGLALLSLLAALACDAPAPGDAGRDAAVPRDAGAPADASVEDASHDAGADALSIEPAGTITGTCGVLDDEVTD